MGRGGEGRGGEGRGGDEEKSGGDGGDYITDERHLVHTHTHIHTHVHTHMYTYTSTNTHYTYIHTHIHTHVYISPTTYIYPHVHKHTHLLSELCGCHGDGVQHGGGVGIEQRHPIPYIVRERNVPIGHRPGVLFHLQSVSCASVITKVILNGRVVHLG